MHRVVVSRFASRSYRPSRPLGGLFNRTFASEAVETTINPQSQSSSLGQFGSSYDPTQTNSKSFGGDEAYEPPVERVEAQFYASGIFPIQLGKADPRPVLASLRKDDLLDQFSLIASNVNAHGFSLLKIERQPKAGGVFLTFSYDRPISQGRSSGESEGFSDRAHTLKEIQHAFQQAIDQFGGLRTWAWWGKGKIHPVLGHPWYEDLNRFPSSQLTVSFEGPDVNQERLYDLLRPFGHLATITPPTPVPPLTLRSASLVFSRLRSSTAAVSCLHGISIPPSSSAPPGTLTRLAFTYQSPIQAHAARDWISSHPRIALPILVALLGTLSYTFFDPIREFFVVSKVNGRFDLEGYSVVQYSRKIASSVLPAWLISPPAPGTQPTDRFIISSPVNLADTGLDLEDGRNANVGIDAGNGEIMRGEPVNQSAWRERQEAVKQTEGWLKEYPSGFIFVTGPAGSGKNALVDEILSAEQKKSIVIDCKAIAKGKTDGEMCSILAHQTGYWPMFGFLASFNQMIDLAAVGLIGQKTGFSTDFPTQLKQILDLVSSALKHVSEDSTLERTSGVKRKELCALRESERTELAERLKRIGWHDGRLDDLAGNGIMSELGYGIERLLPTDVPTEEDALFLSLSTVGSTTLGSPLGQALPSSLSSPTAVAMEAQKEKDRIQLESENDSINSLPVVVLKNFASKGDRKPELWSTIAEWSASLVENRIAQVIVVCDNTSASKSLAKALPSKPINTISLADADQATSLSFVADKLNLDRSSAGPLLSGQRRGIDPEEARLIGLFGGRLNDLEGLINKVRSGLSISESVEDLLQRSQVELRKSVFGDDSEEAKSLPWSRAQAWKIVSSLAKKSDIPYQSLLMSFPFKGAEDKLKNLEAAEVISLTLVNGWPSTVKPGKPMMHATFRKLVEDPVFNASQTISFNSELIGLSAADIKSYETELLSLKEISHTGSRKSIFSFSLPFVASLRSRLGLESRLDPVVARSEYLLRKMKAAQNKIDELEKENAKTLSEMYKHV
ncbi:Mitochondrial escape protein 2 [Phaffia rhodozyma]|uniref:Mitochondrial escape protein 2 n=1 Tax=Phaffia rhodozyma TaxID=264483 RepID=A0A0F7SNN5_PHARH|nr:Mitochondrial escape protein 2 [Phaffia rhodozyma]